MIISASRRTDIPAFYSDWFLNRIKEEYVYVRNPLNFYQVSKIKLSPDVVDFIVFWTKNPEPLLSRLDELKNYNYYFQFTLTSYGNDIEENVPKKGKYVIQTFKKLSDKIGKDRVIWRYDPILLNEKYTINYHTENFEKIAKQLSGYTEKCTISFLDFYKKTEKNLKSCNIEQFNNQTIKILAKNLSDTAHSYGLKIDTCSENIDLSEFQIGHACCIDGALMERLTNCKFKVSKDKNQRKECGCVESIDIGAYNTCPHGCRYCYANFNQKQVDNNYSEYDCNSSILCSKIDDLKDKITERKVKSIAKGQLNLF